MKIALPADLDPDLMHFFLMKLCVKISGMCYEIIYNFK